MKTQIVLIRHGKVHRSKFHDEIVSLSLQGAREILRLSNSGTLPTPDIIFSSPYLRARQTAEIIGNNYKKEIHLVEDLKERKISTRALSDLEFEKCEYKSWSDPHWYLPGGESLYQAQDRIIRCIKDLVSSKEGKVLFIISHGTVLSLFLAFILGTYPQERFHDEILPGARAIIECDDQEFKIVKSFEIP
ncbi:MAG: histidine phosphatase family protein [Promethearchaeota archaeon]